MPKIEYTPINMQDDAKSLIFVHEMICDWLLGEWKCPRVGTNADFDPSLASSQIAPSTFEGGGWRPRTPLELACHAFVKSVNLYFRLIMHA